MESNHGKHWTITVVKLSLVKAHGLFKNPSHDDVFRSPYTTDERRAHTVHSDIWKWYGTLSKWTAGRFPLIRLFSFRISVLFLTFCPSKDVWKEGRVEGVEKTFPIVIEICSDHYNSPVATLLLLERKGTATTVVAMRKRIVPCLSPRPLL